MHSIRSITFYCYPKVRTIFIPTSIHHNLFLGREIILTLLSFSNHLSRKLPSFLKKNPISYHYGIRMKTSLKMTWIPWPNRNSLDVGKESIHMGERILVWEEKHQHRVINIPWMSTSQVSMDKLLYICSSLQYRPCIISIKITVE